MKLCCYKCGSQEQLLVEEKRCKDTGTLVEKNFICLKCAGGAEKVFSPYIEKVHE